MNKSIGVILVVSVMLLCTDCSTPKEHDGLDPFVRELLESLTLEEKVGQMMQLTMEVFTTSGTVQREFSLDTAKVRRLVVEKGIGSVFNTGGEPHTAQRWGEIISVFQKMAVEETRSKIPVLFGIDAVHGHGYASGATLFPHQVGIGATWNPELVREASKVYAYESRATNIPWIFSPSLDVGFDPRWSRQYEGFGEDPYLTTIMGVSMTEGIQGDDLSNAVSTAACLKHFIGYSVPKSGRDRTPAWIPERIMRELFVPPFRDAFDAGAATVMVNSGEVNGIPAHSSYALLTTLLREELGFKGLTISDWADVNKLNHIHRIAADKKEAIKLGINAGIDMVMVPYDEPFDTLLIELINDGQVTMERIDEAVGRILQLKYDLGLFENPIVNLGDYPDYGSQKHIELARATAAESITMLKNDDEVLPLSQDTRVLVTGPNANSMRTLVGGWSYSWQGDIAERYTEEKNTILEAIRDRAGQEYVTYEPGVTYPESGDYKIDMIDGLDKVVQAASNVDVIVLCLGENSYNETPGDLNTLSLSPNQIRLAQTVAGTGKPVVLVLNAGRPRIIREIEPLMDAILEIYLPGNEGGDALAEVLYGDTNPSGRLPYTYPRYVNHHVPYYFKTVETVNYQDSLNYNRLSTAPQFPFGYGLSYTNFEYSELKADQIEVGINDTLRISVNVKNTGEREGKEVVQVYHTDMFATITPSVYRLSDFRKISLLPGESSVVEFQIPVSRFAFVNINNDWVVEEGDFVIHINELMLRVRVNDTAVVRPGVDWDL